MPMRAAFSLIAATFAVGAAAETPLAPEPAPGIVERAPDAQLLASEGRVPCRDTIHQVREARGLPQLERGAASPDEPLLIAAVDHRINGCSVMVMYNNTSDVRPLPTLPDGPATLQRIPRR